MTEPDKQCVTLHLYTEETDPKFLNKKISLGKRYLGTIHIYPDGRISYNRKALHSLKKANERKDKM